MADENKSSPRSKRERSASNAGSLRKADSVKDINAVERKHQSVKLKRTNSSLNSSGDNFEGTNDTNNGTNSSGRSQSAKISRGERRKSWKSNNTSKLHEEQSSRKQDDAYDEIYEVNRVVKVPSYTLETPADDNEKDFNSASIISQAEISYEKFLRKHFCNKAAKGEDIVHYVGVQSDSEKDMLVITVLKEYEQDEDDNSVLKSVKAIITTLEKDEKIIISSQQLRPSRSILKGNKKGISDRKLLSYIKPDIVKKKLRKMNSNPEIMDGFLTLAKLKLGYLHADKKFKIGVVHWKGQMLEEEILSNNEGSKAFNEFVDMLGDKIELNGWDGFSGGLDVNRNIDGKYAVHTKWNNSELVYHISTLLTGTPQQRKVHIGNDTVVIIFVESDEPFSPEYIHSKFNQVFILVSVETDEQVIKRALANKKNKERLSTATSPGRQRGTIGKSSGNKQNKRNSEKTNSMLDDSDSISNIEQGKGMSLSDPGILSSHTSLDSDFLDAPASPTTATSPKKSRGGGGGDNLLSSSVNVVSSEKSPKKSPANFKKSGNIFEKNIASSNGSDKLGSSGHSTGSSDIIGGVDLNNSSNNNASPSTKKKQGRASSFGRGSKGTFYKVVVLRRDGVPAFPPTLPWPSVFRKGKRFREFLLSKATAAMMASYQSPSFQDRLQMGRRAFLENLKRYLADATTV